jgi:hypothetical protein
MCAIYYTKIRACGLANNQYIASDDILLALMAVSVGMRKVDGWWDLGIAKKVGSGEEVKI